MTYDQSLENFDANGNRLYTADLSIQSPISAFKRSSRFPVDAFAIMDNETFENITQISDNYEMLSLAVIPKFELRGSKRWNVNAGIGLQVNRMLSISEDMDIQLYYKSKMMKNERINRSPSSSINPWSLSAISEIYAGYELSTLVSLGLSGGWGHSITPINVPRTGIAPRTFMQDLHLGINLQFEF